MNRSWMNWKWWVSGGVLLMAGAVGCYSTVMVKEAGREHAVRKIATETENVPPRSEPGNSEPANMASKGNLPTDMHNGGKVKLPLLASFDGDTELTITEETNVVIALTAEADMTRFSAYIQGDGGLKELVTEPPMTRQNFAAGETMRFDLNVPARTGSLIVRAVADVGDATMTASLELKVINPKQVKANASKNDGSNVEDGSKVERDALGDLIQSVPAGAP